MNSEVNPIIKLQQTFQLQQDAYLKQQFPSLEERKSDLQALQDLLKNNQHEIADAINKDFGNRSFAETGLLELFTSIDGLRDARKRVHKWMKPQKRHTSIWFKPAVNKIIPQPLGVVGIIVPWNYPLFLSIGPLTAALAAGNRTMIKMSSNSHNLATLLRHLFSETFPEDKVCIVSNQKGIGSTFTKLAFNHMIFTGSGYTGRQVMAAAAQNLTPVTLELGGKSPTIIAEDYSIKEAVSRLLGGKMYNAGQTCVAPDYVFIPEAKKSEFIASAKAIMAKRYKSTDTQDYTSIIDAASFQRLSDTLQDAKDKGAELINLIPASEPNAENRKFPLHLALNINQEMAIIQDEIFGPLLPVMTYKNLSEVYKYINQHDRPLALYMFTNDKKIQTEILRNTISGGVTINDVLFHVGQHDIPFGGVGESGMGHYHGKEGFDSLSKMRPVMKQFSHPATKLFYAPYSGLAKRIIKLMINR
jgi:coniferyl-aldehyde dehydrogenase